MSCLLVFGREEAELIPRYTLPEMAELWTDRARLGRWLEVELLATEGWSLLGVVPKEDALACRDRAPVVDDAFVAEVAARERVTDHDVAAFVDVVQGAIGPPAGKWIHYGLTSSDVVDTAQGATLAASADVLLGALDDLIEVLRTTARAHRDTAMVGRTHGVHAEPTTFGAKVALWALQAGRDRERLRAARHAVAAGKLSGAVGTWSNVDPAVERHVCAALGLEAVPSTQVVARDRHAQYLYACASIGAGIETFATELRHLQRTEVREAEEGFKPGQKGSSAMPHKRNPILSENLSGLARLLRGYALSAMENVALWHERDISHSSVERVILPDASILTHYLLRTMTRLMSGLRVDADRMRRNLDLSHGLVFSQPVLLALVAGGLTRDEAYRVVQDDAMRAWTEERPFRAILEADERVTLDAGQLEEAFSLSRALGGIGPVFEALDDL